MNCPAELCPYWPGEGCVRAFAPCADPVPGRDRIILIDDDDLIAADEASFDGGLDTWEF